MAITGQGTLKGYFVYQNEKGVVPEAIGKLCPTPVAMAIAPALVAIGKDIAVSLAGKAVESLIDAAAAKTQPEATVLDVTFPLSGFYKANGDFAVENGCLVFHNADKDDLTDATLLGVLVLVPSHDRSAFRFDVQEWKFTRFLKPESGRWFQKDSVRDFVLKIEFLSPGASGLGTRAVFVEHPFLAVTAEDLKAAFRKGQPLPWFAAPAKPSGLPVKDAPTDLKARFLPLNVRITAVETTKPNQFAQWVQDIAREKKGDITAAVKDAVRRSIDENYAATDLARQADAAATAYAAYKTAWDEASTHKAARPKDLGAGAEPAAKDKYAADLEAWKATLTVKVQVAQAKRTLARSAFDAAGLSWSGDLPAIAVE